MKPKTNFLPRFLILAGLLFLFPGLSQALAAPNLIKNPLITPPYIACTGRIDSQSIDAHGDTRFKVIWTITSVSVDGDLYKIYYSDNAGFHNRVESTPGNPLPKPYLLTLFYALSPTEVSKTITETVSLLGYATGGTQKTATCQIQLKRMIVLDVPLPTSNNQDNATTNIVFDGLFTTPDPFAPDGSNNMKIGYNLDSDGTYVYLTFKVLDSTKTKVLYSKTSKINYHGPNSLLWNGKDNNGNTVPAGTYWLRATVANSDPLVSEIVTIFKTLPDKTFNVTAPATNNGDSSTNQSSGSGDESTSASSGYSSDTNTSSGSVSGYSSGTNTSSGSGSTGSSGFEGSSTTEQQAVPLKPSPIELKCSPQAKTLYFENNEPAYDRMFVDCSINLPATVKASIYNKSYDPASADNSANLIKEVLLSTPKLKGGFKAGWDGYDDYDRPAALGEYNFVVEALIDSTFKPKISVKSFKIENVPAPQDETTLSGDSVDTTGSATTDAQHGVADAKPGLLEQVSTAIFGEGTTLTDQEATGENKPAERVMSKCPNVFYPIDITNSPYESLIKKAYDECLVSGYPDGTFRHKDWITRPEAIKMVILASGNIAKQGCYDADCGSPFNDLDMWMGPWVRTAWDNKIVSGVAPDKFGTGTISRAEAVALVDKAFGIPPFQGCYTPNCGAGQPNNFFTDVTRNWQGPYLRAAWDKGIIQTLTPGNFYPDNPMTRAMFLELLYQAKSLK